MMSAMLFELTASAAQMCTPVPAAAPGGFVDWFDHWQTLLGAAIGGGLGVAGAWIVAVSSRNREQRIAARMLRPDLQQLAAAGQELDGWLATQHSVSAGEWSFNAAVRAATRRPAAAVNRLTEGRPALFGLPSADIGPLSDVDELLYAHLSHCVMAHRTFENGIVLQEAASQDPAWHHGTIPSDTQLLAVWQLCVEHAVLAAYFLDQFMFSRRPRWVHRLRMKLRPNDFDRRSAHLLSTGEPLAKRTRQPSARVAAIQG